MIFIVPLCTSGTSALGKLKKAVNKIPIYEAGKIRFQEIDNAVQDFLYNYHRMSREVGEFKNDKQSLGEMQLHMGALEVELLGEWNSDRGGEDIKLSIVVDKKTEVGAKRSHQDDDEKGLNGFKKSKIHQTSGNAERQEFRKDTPKRSHRVIFKKTSPKAELLQKLTCHLCSKAYGSKKALKLHLKEVHKSADVPEGLKEVADKITCRVCPKPNKLGRDLMNRHLRVVHSLEKPHGNYVLRGWFTIDEISWKPLWCIQGENDPPAKADITVPVNPDGQVFIYGIAFDSDEVPTNTKSGEDTGETDVSEDPQVKSVSENEVANVSEQLDFEDGNGLTQTATDDRSEKMIELEKSVENEPDVIKLAQNETNVQSPQVQGDFSGTSVHDQAQMPNIKPSCIRNLSDEFYSDPEEESDVKKSKLPVKVFDVPVQGGVFWSCDSNDIDSDFDENDSKEDDESRRKMKQLRITQRNSNTDMPSLIEIENNKIFIDKFENYMKNKNYKKSTMDKAMDLIFRKPDSLLQFLTKKDPSFNLGRLFNLLGEDFIKLPDPTIVDGWLQSIAGPDGKGSPGRRCEFLKAHAKLREFLKETLTESDYGNSAEAFYKKEIVIKNIDQITTNIKNKKMFQKLNKSASEVSLEKQQAREALNPSNVHNETQAVSTWMESDEAKKETEECLAIYRKVMGKEKFTSKEFVRFGTWAKFSTCLADKNRRGVYSFTNMEYKKKKPLYHPIRDGDIDVADDQFHNLPHDWNSYVPQNEDDLPSCWVIEVKGDCLKGGNRAHVVLTRDSAEICDRYRDMKNEVFDDEEDEAPFFVNMKKKPLSDIQRTKGSLLEKLGLVTGVSNATVNTFR